MTYELEIDQKYKPKSTRVQREVIIYISNFVICNASLPHQKPTYQEICKLYQICYVMSGLDNTSVLYQWGEIIKVIDHFKT